jgi:hypothetical protein
MQIDLKDVKIVFLTGLAQDEIIQQDKTISWIRFT